MDTILQLHEFFVEGSDSRKSHVLLNITEPSTPEEKEKGYFFAICEIFNGNNDYILKLQSIIDDIENSYYEIPDQKDKPSLETVLEKINQQTISLVKPNIGLNCVIGAIKQTDIIFSFHGSPLILFFYQNKQNEYKKMDLISENADKSDDSNKKQIFSQIIQGKISANDYLFAGTSCINNYFTPDRLQKIISNRPPRQSSEHLERVLMELKSELSFGGIIIHLQKQSAGSIPIIKKKKSTSQNNDISAKSLTNLFSTEKNTAKILSPSLLPNIEKIASAFRKTNNSQEKYSEKPNEEYMSDHFLQAEIKSTHLRARQTAKSRSGRQINWQEIIKNILMLVWSAAKYLWKIIVWMFIILVTLIANIGKSSLLLFFIISNYNNRRQIILSDWSRWWKHYIENIKRVPLTIKILFLIVLTAVVALSIGIIYAKNNQKKRAENELFYKTTENIKKSINSAESALIYNDDTTINNNLKIANNLLANLACEPKERETICKTLNEQYDIIARKAQKMTLILPELLADWNNILSNQKAEKIIIFNKKIIGASHSYQNLAIYDILTKQSQTISANIAVNGFSAIGAPKEYDYAIFIYNANNLAQYKPTGSEWTKINIEYPNENVSITALSVYNRRLYTLDSANNQIYRHDASTNGFSKGEEWIKNKTGINLNNGIGIAIDGDIFTLTTNGKLYKFSNGQKQAFNIKGLIPELKSADALWTYFELKYIYILDGINKRLIILDKEGSLKKQITANVFVKPTGMAVDEQNNIAYILDSNKLYKIDLGL